MYIITINNDVDILNFIREYNLSSNLYNLIYLYRMPGYRSYIRIGKFVEELFLEINIHPTNIDKTFQLKWKLSVDVFIDEVNRFGFTKEFNPSDRRGKFLERPCDFDEGQENNLIQSLINISFNNRYFGNRYGLK